MFPLRILKLWLRQLWNNMIELIKPCESLEKDYLEFVQEFLDNKEKMVPFILEYDTSDFAAFIQRLENDRQGIDIPAGWVPASTFWLVQDMNTLLGVAHLRHTLTPSLKHEGGHIGYGVRPSERGKGYGTLMLEKVLVHAKQMDIKRALITCDKDNIASARVIQKNGGILDSEVPRREGSGLSQRYWINLE
jgi:predicted acetyltransferase